MQSTCDIAGFAAPKVACASPRGAVLLVEDEVSVRDVLSRFLSAKGYNVLTAENGRAAESVWRMHRHDIDVVVTDVMLPGGMSGCRLATLLQGQKPGLEVILTTGYDSEFAEFAAGATAHTRFLAKPYRPDEMLELIRETFRTPVP